MEENKVNVYKKLLEVQSRLKAPKLQNNKFGGYKYRSCEDILEAVKPILKEVGATIKLSDEMTMVGERYYIRATALFIDTESGANISNNAYAREEEMLKGMTGAQITGTASSYARKYALNGLLAIDDTKDADTDEFGNIVNGNTNNNTNNKPTPKFVKCTDKQIEEAIKLGVDVQGMMTYFQVKDIKEISKEQFESVLKRKRK